MKSLILALFMASAVFANVGKIVSLRGDATVVRDGQEFKARAQDVLRESDVLKTSANARLQVRFSDDTIVTLGKNSVLNVNKYVINGSNSAVDLAVSSGSYKVISGKISHLARDKFSFKANTATIGIRGTVFVGELAKTPKAHDKVGCLEGAIDVKVGSKLTRINAGRQMSYSDNKVMKLQKLMAKDFEVTQVLKVDQSPVAASSAAAVSAAGAAASAAVAPAGTSGLASTTSTGASSAAAGSAADSAAAKVNAPAAAQTNAQTTSVQAAKLDAAVGAAVKSNAQIRAAEHKIPADKYAQKQAKIEAKKQMKAEKNSIKAERQAAKQEMIAAKQEMIAAKKAAYGSKKINEMSKESEFRKDYNNSHKAEQIAAKKEFYKALKQKNGSVTDSTGETYHGGKLSQSDLNKKLEAIEKKKEQIAKKKAEIAKKKAENAAKNEGKKPEVESNKKPNYKPNKPKGDKNSEKAQQKEKKNKIKNQKNNGYKKDN